MLKRSGPYQSQLLGHIRACRKAREVAIGSVYEGYRIRKGSPFNYISILNYDFESFGTKCVKGEQSLYFNI